MDRCWRTVTGVLLIAALAAVPTATQVSAAGGHAPGGSPIPKCPPKKTPTGTVCLSKSTPKAKLAWKLLHQTTVVVGGPPAILTYQLKNRGGTAYVTIPALRSGVFSIAPDGDGCSGTVLKRNRTCQLLIQYVPKDYNETDTVTLIAAASGARGPERGAKTTITTNSGPPPALAFTHANGEPLTQSSDGSTSSTSYTYPTLDVGATRSVTFTLANVGGATMSGLNFFFADASEAFHLSFDIDTCQPILMDPGTTCTATVVYAPIRVSPQDTATLTVGLTDKPDVKATLTLDGSSATPHPGLVVGSAQSGRLVRQGTMWTGVPIGAQ